MPTDRHRTSPPDERETARSHSAFEEFRRDERRPAVLLLGALVIAAAFFALGIMLGRWMADDDRRDASRQRPSQSVNQPVPSPAAPRPTP
jgi:hypothetical protein